MLVLASAAVICAAVPLSVTELLPLTPPTTVVPSRVHLDIAVRHRQHRVQHVGGVRLSDTVMRCPLSEIAVFSLPLSEAGSAPTPSSYRRAGSPPSSVPIVALLTVSVVVTDRLSGP